MATGITLAEMKMAMTASNDVLAASYVDTFEQMSPLLSRMSFITRKSGTIKYNEMVDLPATTERALNGNYTDDIGHNKEQEVSLALFGGSFSIDSAAEGWSDQGGPESVYDQTIKLARSNALYATKQIIKAKKTTSSHQFNGLEALCTTLNTNLVYADGTGS